MFRRMQICNEKKKTMNTVNEESDLVESADEFDKLDEYQHTYNGLH